jgi:hypothetical protein
MEARVMNAAKRKPKPGPLARFVSPLLPLVGGTGQRVLIGAFLAVGLLGGTYFGWQRWGGQISQQPEYVVLPENIEITPLPPWIRSDVQAEALRDASLTHLSILDRQLTVKIARAFSMHTWVQDVLRVSKHPPAQVVVELAYRQPVAMVEVVISQQDGLLPIDVNGVLLPPGDFSAEQARDYLRISLPDAMPAGSVGTTWGDLRIHGAARIAAVLGERWKDLGLYRIAPIREDSPSEKTQDTRYMLSTRQGTQIIWGKAPDAKSAVDAKAAKAKVAHLLAYVESHGSLDSASRAAEIDLTTRELANPHTASAAPSPY